MRGGVRTSRPKSQKMPTGSYGGVVDGEVELGCPADEGGEHDIFSRWLCDSQQAVDLYSSIV